MHCCNVIVVLFEIFTTGRYQPFDTAKHGTQKNSLVVSVIIFSKRSIQNLDNTNIILLYNIILLAQFFLDKAAEMNKHKWKMMLFLYLYHYGGVEKYLWMDRAI